MLLPLLDTPGILPSASATPILPSACGLGQDGRGSGLGQDSLLLSLRANSISTIIRAMIERNMMICANDDQRNESLKLKENRSLLTVFHGNLTNSDHF